MSCLLDGRNERVSCHFYSRLSFLSEVFSVTLVLWSNDSCDSKRIREHAVLVRPVVSGDVLQIDQVVKLG